MPEIHYNRISLIKQLMQFTASKQKRFLTKGQNGSTEEIGKRLFYISQHRLQAPRNLSCIHYNSGSSSFRNDNS
jgi:hypothetical protein